MSSEPFNFILKKKKKKKKILNPCAKDISGVILGGLRRVSIL
jgi:hypothetical protein